MPTYNQVENNKTQKGSLKRHKLDIKLLLNKKLYTYNFKLFFKSSADILNVKYNYNAQEKSKI